MKQSRPLLQNLNVKIPPQVRQLEFIYAAIALLFGLVFIFLIPPGWSPDEPQHYWRVQQLAHGDIISDQMTSNGRVYTGGKLPQNDANFILSYKGYKAIEDNSLRLHFPMWNNADASTHGKDGGAPQDTVFPGSARYSPIVYLPQTIGIWLGNISHTPLLYGFLFAKLLGLLVQVAAFFFAIKYMPRGKWIIAILGLLPATVVQSTAIGGDVMTTSACIFFIAYVLRLAYTPIPLAKKHLAIVALLTLIIGLVKPAYLPLVALVVIVPLVRKEYRTKQLYLWALPTIAIATLPGLLWIKLTAFVQDNFSNGVDVPAQSAYVLHHPATFAVTLAHTYLTDDQPIGTLKMLFGNFVWGTAPLPLFFMFIGVVALTLSWFISSARENPFVHLGSMTKSVFLCVFFILIAAISYGLYVYFTPLKATSILGIQGRYFIPFLPLLLLVFHTPLPYAQQTKFKALVILLLVAMQVSAIVVLVNRIYI